MGKRNGKGRERGRKITHFGDEIMSHRHIVNYRKYGSDQLEIGETTRRRFEICSESGSTNSKSERKGFTKINIR